MLTVQELKKIFAEKKKLTSTISSVVTTAITTLVEWADIQNKPSVFPPGTHSHSKADITDLNEGLVGTKEVNETDIANTKILQYDSTLGKLVYVTKPTSAGFFNKLDATTNPTVNDDSGDGYEVGSLWFNITTSKVFQCLNATATAAVWVELTGGGTGLPTGGTTGQVLAKLSNTDGDANWSTILSVYDTSEATTFFAALTTPLSSGRQALIRTLIMSLKDALHTNNLSTRFDCLYLFANETAESSLKNLIKRSHDCTNVHSTAFVVDEGYTGDGVNDYINTNYNPSTQKVSLSQNYASMGIYCRSDNKSKGYVDAGCSEGTSEFKMHLSWSDGNQYLRCLSNGGCSETNDNTRGMLIMTRSYSTLSEARQYLNGSEVHTQFSITSTAPPNYSVYVCGSNNAGTLSSPSAGRQYSAFFIGSGFTRVEASFITAAINSYMNAIGKAVLG